MSKCFGDVLIEKVFDEMDEAMEDVTVYERKKTNNNHWTEFDNPEQYVREMLHDDMFIRPTEEEIAHLRELKTATAIDNAVRTIVSRHWSSEW